MKINEIKQFGLYALKKQNKSVDFTDCDKKSDKSFDLNAYPQNYYLSFCAKNPKEAMNSNSIVPSTVKDYIEEHQDEIRNCTLMEVQKLAFKDLENCKTVDDVKEKFPNEICFKDLKKLSEVSLEGFPVGFVAGVRLVKKMQELEKRGVKILKTDEDIPTFLIKKIFLGCEQYDKILVALEENLSDDVKNLEHINNIDPRYRAKFFNIFGISAPNGAIYGATLRADALSILNNNNKDKQASLVTSEEFNEQIVDLLEQDQQSKYSMMDAWNNCPEIRKDLSVFLKAELHNEMAKFLQNDILLCSKEFYSEAMCKIMTAFWDKYPEHKEKLSIEIATSAKRYIQKKEQLSPEDFQKFLEEIENKSKKIRMNILLKGATYDNAFEYLQIMSSQIKYFTCTTEETSLDFASLMYKMLSTEELEILNGGYNTPGFDKIVPDELLKRAHMAIKTPDCINMVNAQNISILELIGKEKQINNLLLNDKTFLKDELNKLISLEKNPEVFKTELQKRYADNKRPLSCKEKADIKTILLKKCPTFCEKDISDLDSFINSQGKYLKNIQNDNAIGKLTLMLFWKAFDDIKGTDYCNSVMKNAKYLELLQDANTLVNKFNFSDSPIFTW